MEWISKQPPIYIFLGDTWLRESDKKLFLMTEEAFKSEDETVYYTKKHKIMKIKEE